MVDFVIDIDADKTSDNINKLEKAFNKAVEAGVKAKLAGTSPEDYGEGAKKSKDLLPKSPTGLRSFRAAEQAPIPPNSSRIFMNNP